MRSDPLGSGSVTRLPALLGPCYTDPEVLKETEGTQLAGQMELLEVSPSDRPVIKVFVSLWEMITGPRVPANHCHQPQAPGRLGRHRWSVWTAVQGREGWRSGHEMTLANSSFTEPVGNNS